MVWISQSCVAENSTLFKEGKIHKRISNTTCIILFCNAYTGLEWYCYVVITFFIIILLIGFLGNTFTLHYFIYSVKSWTTSSILLFNLALCDFTWILLVPFSVYFHLHKQAIYATQTFCKIKRAFFDINIYGSIYFLTLISFDRYVSTVHPIRCLKRWDKSKATHCSAAVWIIIFIQTVPDVYYTFKTQRELVTCLDDIGETLYFVVPFTISRVLLGFLVPTIVIFTCYTLILKTLQKMKKHPPNRQRMIKPLIQVSAAMVVFAIAFIPYHVMILAVLIYRMNYQLDSDNIHLMLTFCKLTEIICSISSSLNPFIFILASKKFQEKFKAFWFSPKHTCLCGQSYRVGDIGMEL